MEPLRKWKRTRDVIRATQQIARKGDESLHPDYLDAEEPPEDGFDPGQYAQQQSNAYNPQQGYQNNPQNGQHAQYPNNPGPYGGAHQNQAYPYNQQPYQNAQWASQTAHQVPVPHQQSAYAGHPSYNQVPQNPGTQYGRPSFDSNPGSNGQQYDYNQTMSQPSSSPPMPQNLSSPPYQQSPPPLHSAWSDPNVPQSSPPNPPERALTYPPPDREFSPALPSQRTWTMPAGGMCMHNYPFDGASKCPYCY